MGSLADITLGDIGRAIARYRPVLITVAIILAVIAVLPGPRRAALSALPSVPPPAAAASSQPAEGDAAASTDTTLAPDDASSSTFDASSSSSSSSGFSSGASTSDFSSDDSSSSSGFEAPSPTSDFSSPGFSTTTTTPSRPLTIVEAGWASATGATPIGATGVPEKALPVGKRIGQVDKYSFVRLEGEQKVLSLRVVPEGARTTTGAVSVSICQVTESGWEAADNVPSDRAPKYDVATCVPGDPGDGTTWMFNLLTFASPTDPRGFALVPTGDSIDYQINFARA